MGSHHSQFSEEELRDYQVFGDPNIKKEKKMIKRIIVYIACFCCYRSQTVHNS